MKARPVYFACALAIAFLIGKASGIAAPPAHRLSGHPSSLAGKLALAKRQVQHDRSPGSHHWLGRDRVYVNQLLRSLQVFLRPAHYAGWWCIHAGAYPGAAHEGSGWNGGHSGPLQMTNPWAGYYAPNGDWNTNWMVAFWTAERVAAAHGFSYVWMRGQWPATYPPCAGRF